MAYMPYNKRKSMTGFTVIAYEKELRSENHIVNIWKVVFLNCVVNLVVI